MKGDSLLMLKAYGFFLKSFFGAIEINNKLFKQLSILVVALIGFTSALDGQPYNRLTADFSLKEIDEKDSARLITGKVYFDQGNKQIVYDIQFPRNSLWVINDSFIYKIKGDSLISRKPVGKLVAFSIFNLALSGDLENYGLAKTPYNLENVREKDGKTIMTWKPPEKLNDKFGKIELSRKGQEINALISYDPKGGLIGQQFFRDFVKVEGLLFPQKIYQKIYTKKGMRKKITSYSNIKLNNFNNEEGFYVNLSDRIDNFSQ